MKDKSHYLLNTILYAVRKLPGAERPVTRADLTMAIELLNHMQTLLKGEYGFVGKVGQMIERLTKQINLSARSAVCGLPLGSTERLCDARMQNLIGDEANDWQKYMAMPNAKLHLYGKSESRPGRKMGHVTFLVDSR